MKILHSPHFHGYDHCMEMTADQSCKVNKHQPANKSLAYKQTLTGIIFIVTCFFFSKETFAQTNPTYTRSYLSNVVDIGLSDFGLITGEDSMHIYFIAVRRSLNEKNSFAEKIASNIKQVKFFNNAYKAKASKIKEARFGAFTVVLYQSPRPPSGEWQRNYYYSLTYKKGKLSTFRDKWMSDKIWSVHDTKIEILKQPKAGVAIIHVPHDAGIAKGMPLINSDGFVGGIFAESTLGKTTVCAINMKDIADALYIANGNDCHYFNMVEWGKTDTRCVLEQLAKQTADEKAKREAEEKAKRTKGKLAKNNSETKKDTAKTIVTTRKKPEPKKHFIDYGINAGILYDPLTNNQARNNDFNTKLFHLGLSLHFNIDKKGYNRLTLKPRYGSFTERNDDSVWISPDQDVRIVVTSYKYAEMPVVFERQLFSNSKYSIAIGAGYSPALIFGHRYQWWDKSVTGLFTQSVPGTSIMHRIIGELHFYEFKFGRLMAVYMKDISGYPHADYKLPINGNDYTPFASRKKAWYLGMELSIRLRGSWGQQKPSR